MQTCGFRHNHNSRAKHQQSTRPGRDLILKLGHYPNVRDEEEEYGSEEIGEEFLLTGHFQSVNNRELESLVGGRFDLAEATFSTV